MFSKVAKQLLLILVLTISIDDSKQQGCPIDVISLYPWDALVTTTNTYEILYPPITNSAQNYTIVIPVGDTIIISCPKGKFLQDTGLKSIFRTVYATCNQDNQLESQEDKVINFANMGCITHDPISIQITNDNNCTENSTIIEIGLQIGINIKKIPLIRTCFDTIKKIPLYTYNNLTKSIGFIKSYLQTLYLDDGFYNYDESFDDIYNLTNQQRVLNALLGDNLDSVDYINPQSCDRGPNYATTPGFCLGLSPLVYRGAFVYLMEQYSTFRYINTVPAWTFVYEYNWNRLERSIIDFVKNKKIDLQVYTGTWGVTTLQHSKTKIDTDLYLYVNDIKPERSLAIPALLWKLIYDPVATAATVFITVNNPYRVKKVDLICDDVSDEIAWVTWEKENVTKGYSYACRYGDAKKTIEYMPELYVTSILK